MSSALQKTLVKFLLKRIIGQFLLDELDVENLKVQVGTGFLQLKEIQLKPEALNELISDSPIRITHGKIANFTAQVPWKDIWTGACVLEFHNLEIVVVQDSSSPTAPKTGPEDSPIVSSIGFAGDILKHEVSTTDEGEQLKKFLEESAHSLGNDLNNTDGGTEEPGNEGIQILAGVIDSIIAKVKITFHETKIRFHHQPRKEHLSCPLSTGWDTNHYIDINLPLISYESESQDPGPKAANNGMLFQQSDGSTRMFTLKGFGISLHKLEQTQSQAKPPLQNEKFIHTAALLSALSHENTIRIQTDGRHWNVNCLIHSIVTVISPNQMSILEDIVDAFTISSNHQRNSVFDYNSTGPGRGENLRRQENLSADYLHSLHSKTEHKAQVLGEIHKRPQFCTGNKHKPQLKAEHLKRDDCLGQLEVHVLSWCSYFLADDADHPDQEALHIESHNRLDGDHIKVFFENLSMSGRKWGTQSRSSSVRGSYNVGVTDQGAQEMSLEVKINKCGISEWIRPLADTTKHQIHQIFDSYHLLKRGVYLPILRFDSNLVHSYDSRIEVSMSPLRGFPSFCVDGGESEDAGEVSSEDVQLQFSLLASLHNNNNNNQRRSDLMIEAQPLHLHINSHAIDRYQGYFPINSNTPAENPDNADVFRGPNNAYDGQEIINDLDERTFGDGGLRSTSTQFRFKTSLLRIWLTIPDLQGAVSSKEIQHRQSQCRIHKDAFIVDFVDPVISNGSTVTNVNQLLRPDSFDPFYQHKNDAQVSTDTGQNIRFEWFKMNLFLKEAQDSSAICFLVVAPMVTNEFPHKILPNIELTCTAQGETTLRKGKVPRMKVDFPHTFSSFEGEEVVKLTDEDQKEEVVIFKQCTLENSIYVVNCNLPNVYISMTRHRADLVQVLLDSLSRYQLHSKRTGSTTKPFTSVSSLFQPDHINGFEHIYEKHNNNKQINLLDTEDQLESMPPNPSLASVVAVAQNIEIVVMCSSTSPSALPSANSPKYYELQFGESEFFGVICFQGDSTAYFHLDTKELSLADITNPTSNISIISKVNAEELKVAQDKSMLVSTFVANTNSTIENRATISTNNLVWNLNFESTFLEDMSAFGMGGRDTHFDEQSRPTLLLSLTVQDSLIDFTPSDYPAKAIVLAESLRVSSSVDPQSPITQIKLFLRNTTAFLINDSGLTRKKYSTRQFSNLRSFYQALGYAMVSSVDFLEVIAKFNKADQLPHLDLEITNQSFVMETCSDSFQTLVELVNYISQKFNDSQEKDGGLACLEVDEAQNADDTNEGDIVLTDMLSSLDENAFGPPSLDNTRCMSCVDALPVVEDRHTVETNQHLDILEDYLSDLDDSEDDGWVAPRIRYNDRKEPSLYLEDTVNTLDTEDMVMVEDYFSIPDPIVEQEKSNTPQGLYRFRIRDFNVTWKLYAGSDWSRGRHFGDSSAVKSEFSSPKASKGKDKETFFDTSSDLNYYIYEPELIPTTPSGAEYASSAYLPEKGHIIDDDDNDDNDDLNSVRETTPFHTQIVTQSFRDIRSDEECLDKIGRSQSSQVDIKLVSINTTYEQYPLGTELASKVRLTIRDVEIIDLVQTSVWKKFLSYLRPDSDTSPRESSSNMISIELDQVRPNPNILPEELRLKIRLLPIRLHIDQDTLEFMVSFFEAKSSATNPKTTLPKDPRYFQYFEVFPVVLKLDYKPKHLDFGSLRGGNLIELLNLFRLEEADIMLLGVKLRGVNGVERLYKELSTAWKPYIISTQVPNVVNGVAPIKALVNLGTGITDLVLLPVEQYLKDGQLIKGIQRGATSFAKTTTMEMIKLGTRLAIGAQGLLEQADVIFSFDAEGAATPLPKSKYSEQPSDFNEGIELAYKSLSKNIGNAAHSLVIVPIQMYDRLGAQRSIRAMVRRAPSAVLKPMIGATEAISKILLGAQNSIDPNKRLQMEDKYK